MADLEQLAQESALWPWLDTDAMADPSTDLNFFDQLSLDEDLEDELLGD